MTMHKEKWIEEVMQSTKGMQPAEANPFLATRVEAKLRQPTASARLSLRWIYLSAAAMIILLIMNLSVLQRWRPANTASSGIQDVMQFYGWDNNNLYSSNFSNSKHE